MTIIFGEKKIVNLAGETMKDENGAELYVSRLVGNMLLEKSDGDYIKKYEMAKKFYGFQGVEVDTSDRKLIEKAIDESRMPTIIKAQVKLELENMHQRGEDHGEGVREED